jgi:hypothetical protein
VKAKLRHIFRNKGIVLLCREYCTFLSVIRIIKSRRMRWAGHVARIRRRKRRRKRMLIGCWWENQRERGH